MAKLRHFLTFEGVPFQQLPNGLGIAMAIATKEASMLKVRRSANGQLIFILAGRMAVEDLAELEALFQSEARTRKVVLDLKDLTLVDRDAVRFLGRCEADKIRLRNCPAYIREWIRREGEQRHD
jgi:hypothetical protein